MAFLTIIFVITIVFGINYFDYKEVTMMGKMGYQQEILEGSSMPRWRKVDPCLGSEIIVSPIE